jgi:hypothetical protein
VSVFRQNVNSADKYTFLGRYRAHYKPIRALFFNTTLDDNLPILTTIGETNRSLSSSATRSLPIDPLQVPIEHWPNTI